MMRAALLPLCATAISGRMIAAPAMAAGDFPVSSCKSWNATVIEREGIDSGGAMMKGIITKADLQEYCERSGRTDKTIRWQADCRPVRS